MAESASEKNAVHWRDPDSVELIRKIAAGDTASLATWYESSSRLIYGLVLKSLAERAAAEEVLIDVYLKGWRDASSYDPALGSPLTWLAGIARAHAIDRLRAGKPRPRRQESSDSAGSKPSDSSQPEEATVSPERQRVVRTALQSLEPLQREAIELAYYAGLSHMEIAAQLGQAPETARSHLRLGAARLSELLGPWFESGA